MREYRLASFDDGLNNVGREDQIPATALRKATNVDLLVAGRTARLRRRKGRQRIVAGTGCHSGYAASNFVLAVEAGALKLWRNLAQAPETIAVGVGEVGYAEVNDRVIWSDGAQTGQVYADGTTASFGVPAPTAAPSLQGVGQGGLDQGTYLVTMTYILDGVESGTCEVQTVVVPEGGGVLLTSIPQPTQPGVEAVNIYASQANGETLYFRIALPVGSTTYLLGALDPRRALRTLMYDRLPASRRLAVYNGYLFSLVGDTTYFSRPLNFSSYHTTEDYILHDAPGNLILSGDQGIFVGTETGVRFYGGAKPDSFSESWVSPPAIADAGLSLDGGHIVPNLQGQTVAVWWTVDGVMMLGLPDGSVEPVRSTEFRGSNAERGVVAAAVREGTKQLVTVLKNPGTVSPMAFSDSMTIEVHKHGVA